MSLAEVLHTSILRFLRLPTCMDHLSSAVKIQTRVPGDGATLHPQEVSTWMQLYWQQNGPSAGMLAPTLTLLFEKPPLSLHKLVSVAPWSYRGSRSLALLLHLPVFTPAADLSMASGKSSPAHCLLDIQHLTPAHVCPFWLSTAPLMSWSCSTDICYIDHWRKVL